MPKPGPSKAAERVAEVVTNDAGDVDLGDFQYAAFTLFALVYFAWAFIATPGDGLPPVPGTLLILMGVSQAAYLTKKGLRTTPPEEKDKSAEGAGAPQGPG